MRKKILTILIIFFLFLPSFNFAQENSISFSLPSMPQTLEEGIIFLKKIIKELPEIIIKIWKEEVFPFFKKIFNWFKINIWSKIENPIKKEIEKRKEIFKEELKKETEKTFFEKIFERIKKIFKFNKNPNYIVRHFLISLDNLKSLLYN